MQKSAADSQRRMQERTLRVLLAEGHPLVRRGLRAVLEDEGDLAVVGEASDAAGVLALAAESQPDVVLLDLHLKNADGVHVVRELAAGKPPVPTLVLSSCKAPELLRGALAAGASGFLLKDEPPERIVEAVRGAAAGQDGWLSREVAASLREAWYDPLTPKELEVVRELAEGHAIPEVAVDLKVCPRTVRNHLANVYSKLDLHSQSELVAWAWRNGVAGLG